MIWCVEDDASIRDIEVYALQSTGFSARGFEDGASFWEALQSEQPELIILDVMLPGIDGLELLQRIRENRRFCNIPVVLATAKGAEYDKIKGLDLGADYYLVKPFGVMELLARVRALLRRSGEEKAEDVLTHGPIMLDRLRHRVTAEGAEVVLTHMEFELLAFLMAHPGQALTREVLLDDVWGMAYAGDTRTVDVHIRTLRQKLGSSGSLIATVRGVGYRLEDEHA